jgi:sugar transferase (PEP-CTERM/EpsH1 system associated)
MQELLYLVHRIPYPPNKGDKIRSFHILRHLSRHFRVHLGAFVDDPDDWRYKSELEKYCGEICLLPLTPWRSKLKSLQGLLTGEALSLPYYSDARMRAWVKGVIAERPLCGAMAFSSAMAQYLEDFDALKRVIDFVDVDSDKWRQYAARKPWPANWVYAREGRELLVHDRRIAARFDLSLLVSQEEAALFRRLAPESAEKIEAMENGVDEEYFDGGSDYPNPYPDNVEALTFTGAMDYWANVDAVDWFASEVFPLVSRDRPQARFYIVGARPAQAVLELGRREGITVTGAVPDIRPYLAHARLAVAPLRIARGVQNKVLEAMAMGRHIVSSSPAIEGIERVGQLDLAIADAAEDWKHAIMTVLDGGLPKRSARNRAFVLERYGWSRNLRNLDGLWGK